MTPGRDFGAQWHAPSCLFRQEVEDGGGGVPQVCPAPLHHASHHVSMVSDYVKDYVVHRTMYIAKIEMYYVHSTMYLVPMYIVHTST